MKMLRRADDRETGLGSMGVSGASLYGVCFSL
jgi:hypothetical protein